MDKEKLLSQLLEKLKHAHGAQLVSVVLYGSAAAGDHQDSVSDLNILCLLTSISPADLAAAEPVFRWWRDKGHPAPLLMAIDEIPRSADTFPIEFHDILDCRRVLLGDDIFATVRVEDTHYRTLVEHELRAKLLRLRQKAAGLASDRELLIRLMADSVSTFCVLTRHVLRLMGHAAPRTKREAIAAATGHLSLNPSPFYTLLDLREGKIGPKSIDSGRLFSEYLLEVSRLVEAVDRRPIE
jgi:hypothetical protein